MSRLLFGTAVTAVLAVPQAVMAACAAPRWAGRLERDLDRMAAQLDRTLKAWPVPPRRFRPEDFGHRAGALATAAIQQAIEACAAAGGGTVRLAEGDYVSGTLVLRSGVMLEIAEGARLLGSTDLRDYPDHVARRPTVMDSNMAMNQSLIFAEGCERIGICGKGQIDGRGTRDNFPGEETSGPTPGRPFLIRVIDCRQVTLRDIRLKDSPCWMQNYLNCEDMLIDGIQVENQANVNNDGADIDGCRRVIVRNCHISSEDDGLCFKGASERPMERVLVENCRIYSSCNALKFGTDSQGDFRNVLVRNVELGGPAPGTRVLNMRKADGGVSWESVDGGIVERLVVRNARIVRSESPLFLRLGDRGRVRPEQPRPAPGVIRQIVFAHITGADNGMRGSYFTGVQGAQIRDVLLRDVTLPMAAADLPVLDDAAIPEKRADYPDPPMFGRANVMPAYGLWTRHVSGLTMIDVHFPRAAGESRPDVKFGPDTSGTCVRP
ncbi:MAG: hypothetical protein KGJ78_02825 [Alphaproteobacteria bacterium]|nr:hypothetical protein [Alphaproteobacteria bacterium]